MDNIIQLSHTYRKIKASCKFAPDHLFRTFLVRSDLSLNELGCVLCTVFHAEYEHCFLFHTPNADYVPEVFLDDFPAPKYLLMDDYSLSDLPDTFVFEYDTGEGWDFKCRLYKKEEVRTDARPAILVNGVGAGLWEDAAGEFMDWICGLISPKKKHGKGDVPWNLSFKTYGDLDKPLDIEKEQEIFDLRIEEDIRAYTENMSQLTGDEDDEHDAIDGMEAMLNIVASFAAFQIENVPFVRDTYSRLCKKYSEDKAFDLIASALSEHLFNIVFQQSPYSNKSYEETIKKLK